MSNNWRKLGKIIEPQPGLEWMQSHGMLPIPYPLDDDRVRVYFSGRDSTNRSHIGYAEVSLRDPGRAVNYAEKAVLAPGDLGCFDDNGVTPSSIVKLKDRIYLYYVGWKPRSTVRFGLVAGLAVSVDNGLTFERVSRAPILRLTDKEPISILTAPFVLKEQDRWSMWYVSGKRWINPDLPEYNIKYAYSDDGISWNQTGHVCIENRDGETALARPFVLRENGIYRMWYSYKYKGNPYTIGYAESADGLSWQRKDDMAGIGVSESGWDSEMVEYAYLHSAGGKEYMFYNGNDYGRFGIGLAVRDKV